MPKLFRIKFACWLGLFSTLVFAVSEGDRAPASTLMAATGKKYDVTHFAAQQRKRNLLLIFFRTGNCGICLAFLQGVAVRSAEFEANNVAIVAVSTDDAIIQTRTSEKIEKKYPLLMDIGGKYAKAFDVYSEKEKFAKTSAFLIGSDGKVLYKLLADRPSVDALIDVAKHYSGLIPKRSSASQ